MSSLSSYWRLRQSPMMLVAITDIGFEPNSICVAVEWQDNSLIELTHMATAHPPQEDDSEPTPLLRLKMWRTVVGLSQKQVAILSRIAVRQYRRIENLRQLPGCLQVLDRITKSLGFVLECNFIHRPHHDAKRHLRQISTVAACYRSPYLYLATMNEDRTINVRLIRASKKGEVYLRLEPALIDISPDLFIMEPGLVGPGQLGRYSGEVREVSLEEAKHVILPGIENTTNEQLFRDMVHHYPEHKHRVLILANGKIAMSDVRRVNQLIAPALGIADHLMHHHEDRSSSIL